MRSNTAFDELTSLGTLKTSSDADTLTSKDSRFRFTACDPYGYGDGPHTATPIGETVVCEAEIESPQYGCSGKALCAGRASTAP